MASTPLSPTATEELANEVMGGVAEALESLAPATAVVEVAADAAASAASEVITEPGGATTTWSRGAGLDGSFYEPDSLEELIDFIGDIEFKASLDSENQVIGSSLEGRAYLYDESNKYFGQWQLQNRTHNYERIYDYKYIFSDISIVDGKPEIEFSENLKGRSGSRQFIERLVNSIDYIGEGSILITPTHFRARGLLAGYGTNELNRRNPINEDFSELSEIAPVAIKITQGLIDEIDELRNGNDDSINLDASQIIGFGSETHSNNNITIKIADYQDHNGDISAWDISSDLRFGLQLDSNVADLISDLDDVVSRYKLINHDEAGVYSYLELTANDHDKESLYNDSFATDFVESTADSKSNIELILNDNELQNAFYLLEEGETSITYAPYSVNLGIATLSGSASGLIDKRFNNELSNGDFASITLDFTDYQLPNVEEGDIYLSIEPLVGTIDIAKLHEESVIGDFDHDGVDYASYWGDYQIVDSSGNELGHIYFGEISRTNYIDGYVYLNNTNFTNAHAYLRQLGIAGGIQNGDHVHLSLEFDYDRSSDSVNLSRIDGYGLGEQYRSEDGSGPLPENIQFNWEKFADLDIINFESGFLDNDVDVDITTYLSDGSDPEPGDASILLSYNLYQQENYLIDEPNDGVDPINQLAVLGDAVDHSSRFVLDINAESLEDDYNIESTDITIKFDPQLFGTITASDIKIGGALPLANAVHIDNEAGTIRLAAASLSDLEKGGSGIWGEEALASIALDFDEDQIQYLDKNPDGSLKISPLTFDISVNEQETVFSTDFIDDSGLLNREIVTLDDLGGSAEVVGQEVTLYEAQINLEQQGDGLVLGTERVIGADASYTNLVRKGDTITTSTEWLNVGNIEATDLTYSEISNDNASLVLESASFSQDSVASGSFVDGEFEVEARESTVFTADINITGEAGNVVDLSDGIVAVYAAGTSDVFTNEGQGSSNLITFQGDLNYDGRVSMKDLAYLNAGAARQEDAAAGDLLADANQDGIVDATVANDVDADFSGKIDLADLSVLDEDWGKTLHTGDEAFQGSSDVSWDELDSQGTDTTWDNDSFKSQNAIEAETDYVGSLESPTSIGVIGADGNDIANDNDIQGGEFQDPLAA